MVFAIRSYRDIFLTRPLGRIQSSHFRSYSKKIDTPPSLVLQKASNSAPQKSSNRLLVEEVRAIQLKPREQWTEKDYDTLDKAERTFAATLKGSRKYDEWQKKVRE